MSVISPKAFHVGFVLKFETPKVGLTLHTRAKHGEKTAVTKSVSPLTSKVVSEIVDKATKSVVDLKLYGESVSKLLDEAELKPSEDLVKHLETLYDQYCEKLDRDKLKKLLQTYV